MREEEAKTKWCPFTRVLNWTATTGDGIPNNATASNRSKEDAPLGSCIASLCMAWRAEVEEVVDVTTAPTRPYREAGFLIGWEGDRCVARKPGRGFCGLAGQPQ